MIDETELYTSPWLNDQRKLVLAFTKYAHASQKSKYTDAPYWEHPYKVAKLISEEASCLRHDFALEIALLHDVLEDTRITAEEMADYLFYGCDYNKLTAEYICRVVEELTDRYTKTAYPELNRKQRKERENLRLVNAHWISKSVKCADLACNLLDIVEHDTDFAKLYLQEAETMLFNMPDADARLKRVLKEEIDKAHEILYPI